MKRLIQLVMFVFLASATIVLAAESSSGYLVNSDCYEAAHRNGASAATVSRDMKSAIKRCVPNPQTKSFGVVESDWEILNFDSVGNAKAADLLRTAKKQSMYRVTVIGDKNQNVLKVDSISMAL